MHRLNGPPFVETGFDRHDQIVYLIEALFTEEGCVGRVIFELGGVDPDKLVCVQRGRRYRLRLRGER
ncbi:MAG TPA: hypothetical protein VF546_04665 [Pyrinomonadaceae bacterium]|jgi:hypothetical protein